MKAFVLFLIFTNSACEFNEDKESPPEAFTYEFYNFPGEIELNTDLIIDAKNIYFENGTKIKLNNFNLYLNAQTISFSNTEIISFDEFEYNGCEKDGRDGGSIYINALNISGDPTIQLKGENAGKNGYGYRPSVNNDQFYHPNDDKKEKRLPFVIKNECPPSQPITNQTIKDFWLKTKYHGGNAGNLYFPLEADLKEFYPNIIQLRGRGDFIFTVEERAKDLGWWHKMLTGNNGRPTEVCFFKDDFENCFEEISLLKNYLNQREK